MALFTLNYLTDGLVTLNYRIDPTQHRFNVTYSGDGLKTQFVELGFGWMIVRKAVFVNDSYREREYVPVVVPPVLICAKPVKKVETDVKGGEAADQNPVQKQEREQKNLVTTILTNLGIKLANRYNNILNR